MAVTQHSQPERSACLRSLGAPPALGAYIPGLPAGGTLVPFMPPQKLRACSQPPDNENSINPEGEKLYLDIFEVEKSE